MLRFLQSLFVGVLVVSAFHGLNLLASTKQYEIEPPVQMPASVPPLPSVESVKGYVRREAVSRGVNPLLADWIVYHESQYHDILGDDGQSRGYWQISRTYHPEVSDSCTHDLACSTDWSLNQILLGKAVEWSTYKFCHTWYADCPF